MEKVREDLEDLTSMGITLEQHGASTQFLECQLGPVHSQHPISLPDYKSEVAGRVNSPHLKAAFGPGNPKCSPNAAITDT